MEVLGKGELCDSSKLRCLLCRETSPVDWGMEEDSTSVSSGLGASGRHLKANANISTKTKWLKGRNFFDVPSQKASDQWVSQL